MNNIALVGFMGTGKTTIARMLAEKFHAEYVDIDELIEIRQKMSIVDIFAKHGEQFFRKLEKEVVTEIAGSQNKIIACGGGVVLDADNIANLKKNGILICLQAKPEVIIERTKDYLHRPLLNVPNPKEKIRELLNIREIYYAKADYTVDTSSLNKTQVVDKIVSWLKIKNLIVS
ncbi:MAG: shikimate kinase [Candidatus Omnitrophota bacterium]